MLLTSVNVFMILVTISLILVFIMSFVIAKNFCAASFLVVFAIFLSAVNFYLHRQNQIMQRKQFRSNWNLSQKVSELQNIVASSHIQSGTVPQSAMEEIVTMIQLVSDLVTKAGSGGLSTEVQGVVNRALEKLRHIESVHTVDIESNSRWQGLRSDLREYLRAEFGGARGKTIHTTYASEREGQLLTGPESSSQPTISSFGIPLASRPGFPAGRRSTASSKVVFFEKADDGIGGSMQKGRIGDKPTPEPMVLKDLYGAGKRDDEASIFRDPKRGDSPRSMLPGPLDCICQCMTSGNQGGRSLVQFYVDEAEAVLDQEDIMLVDEATRKNSELGYDNYSDGKAVLELISVPSLAHLDDFMRRVGRDWDLNILALAETVLRRPIVQTGLGLLQRDLGRSLYSLLNRSPDCVMNFFAQVESRYRDNPYHNKYHAAVVGHTAYILCKLFLRSEITTLDRLVIVIASLAHDVGHPGRNNAYLTNVSDPLALAYNDTCILENFHAFLTFSLASKPQCDIFGALPKDVYKALRQQIINLILATDMSAHFECVSKFRLKRQAAPDFPDIATNLEDKWFVAKMCIKAADLAHVAINWSQHFQWSNRLKDEFYLQGDEELRSGVPVSPLCDRGGEPNLANSQAGFIAFVTDPLFQELAAIDRTGYIQNKCIAHMNTNQRIWKHFAHTNQAPSFAAPILPESPAQSHDAVPSEHRGSDARGTVTTTDRKTATRKNKTAQFRTTMHAPSQYIRDFTTREVSKTIQSTPGGSADH
eukprot:GHVO01050190.1.p1 GENE.GHVO01050190.1~~GHVO01050190.1.p1  ORF type:complete len:829 (-),score=91.34 GHVO01050190.1:209-2494(-)